MLAKLFNVFETTEIQLTPSAIKRLRLSALLSIPMLPSFAAIELLSLTGNAKVAMLALGIISALAALYCFSTRMANRLWIPEKYLDEAEIERKRRSGSLTYQLLIWICAFALPITMLFFGGLDVDSDVGTVLTGRALVFLLGSIFMITLSVQTAIAAWMTPPLSEDGNVERVPMDARYKWIMGAILLIVIGGSFMGGPRGFF